ncbi:hypothetical protein [Streptomyces sp. CS159]|uniref:hypothetical protein n=1 Tax=Streptomyces sp. CS159 TaxID=1982762 RepID=UPI001180E9DB|nr:hypothetical protein [Streptomyces sp. CS159]
MEEAVDLALDWEVVEIGLQGGRAGRVRVFEDAHGIGIEPLSSASIETLDAILEGIDTQNIEKDDTTPSLEPAFEWFAAQQGSRDVYRRLPSWMGGLYVKNMQNYARKRPWDLPEDTDLGGFTVREARPLIGTLRGMSLLQLSLFRGEPHPNTAYLSMTPETLSKFLRKYNPRNGGVGAFIKALTYSGLPGSSPYSTPIIPWGDLLIMPFPLLAEGAEERLVLRAAASNPATSGLLGKSLGTLGRRWGDRLGSIPNIKVVQEVKVFDPGRRKVGDLDIVALCRNSGKGLIVEAKWPIDARNLSDAWKQEAAIDKGRKQIGRLKAAIADGATVKLPPDWPGIHEVEWTWIVGTARYLDARQVSDDVAATSLRLVEQILPVGDLNELLTRLRDYPFPSEGKDFLLRWKKIKVNGQSIRCRMIEIMPSASVPPADRKRSTGWT